MKQGLIVLTILMGFNIGSIYSQDSVNTKASTSSSILKGFSFEITATPFVGNNRLINATQVRLRHETSDSYHVRLGLWFDMESNRVLPNKVLDRSYYSIRPGVEWHLINVADKFSAYLALDAVISGAAYRQNTNFGTSIEGAWDVAEIKAMDYSNRGYFNIGAALSAGFDYYLYKHIYVGSEFGFEYSNKSYSEVLVGGDQLLEKTSSATFKSILDNSVRIGFKF